MSGNFRSFDRDTLFLMPPSVQDWIPKEHLARFVVEIVEQLDLRVLRESYAGRGSAAYHPEMLVALVFYGYATGVRASRKLEAATYESVLFRFITANTHPDHDTISDFRARFLPQLGQIFEQLLVLAHEMGALKVGHVSLDGTKIRANASKHNALSLKRGSDLQRRFAREARRMLELAEQADREDTGDDEFHLPAELARREDRILAIKEAMERIRARDTERVEREKAEREESKAERRQLEETNGRPFEARIRYDRIKQNPNAQINLTDEDSRIMRGGEGFVQAYNGQLGVDVESMLIIGEHLTQRAIDVQQIKPALETLNHLPIGKPSALIADAGYYSELNVERCAASGIEPYISIGREKHHWGLNHWRRPAPPGRDASALAIMRYRLRTPAGRAIYARRKCTVEPVIGNLKRSMNFRQFLLRGFEKASGEWTLACLSWNLRRLHALSLA
jgi:transposase